MTGPDDPRNTALGCLFVAVVVLALVVGAVALMRWLAG